MDLLHCRFTCSSPSVVVIVVTVIVGFADYLTLEEAKAEGDALILGDGADCRYQGRVLAFEGGKLEAGVGVLMIEEVGDGAGEAGLGVSAFSPLTEDVLDG